jgi:hypothetical protein
MELFKVMLTTFAILYSLNCNATQENRVVEMGVFSCDQWENLNTPSSIATKHEWLLGYLSGMATATQIDFLKGHEENSLFSWMNNYCHKNRLKSISDGAGVLIKELKKNMKH